MRLILLLWIRNIFKKKRKEEISEKVKKILKKRKNEEKKQWNKRDYCEWIGHKSIGILQFGWADLFEFLAFPIEYRIISKHKGNTNITY